MSNKCNGNFTSQYAFLENKENIHITKYITDAIEVLYSAQFQNILRNIINPYGSGGASNQIIKVLESVELDRLIHKNFYNLSKS